MASNESVILLLGKLGVGKSTFGNFILGEKKFNARAAFGGVTGTAKCESIKIGDNTLNIIDTPGLLDANLVTDADKFGLGELAKGLELVVEHGGAVDVVFYVQSCISRISAEEDEILKYLKDSGTFEHHVIPIFSRAFEIGDTGEEQKTWINEQLQAPTTPPNFRSMMTSIGDRFATVDSKKYTEEYRTEKLTEILHMLEEVKSSNQGEKYSTELFKRVYRKEVDAKTAIKEEILTVQQKTKEAGGGGSCFPEDAVIATESGTKMMKDLCLGEKVLCITPKGKNIYSEVIAFLHYEPTDIAAYSCIETSQGSITISPNHLIFVATHQTEIAETFQFKAVFAGSVRKGDHLVYTNGREEAPSTAQVKSVKTVRECGVYAPLTYSGTIIVNDVSASCYASFESHKIAHLAFAPLRIMKHIYKPNHTRPRKHGIHPYASFLIKVV